MKTFLRSQSKAQPGPITRREMIRRTGAAMLATAAGAHFSIGAEKKSQPWPHGVVVGENEASRVGQRILADGGNAVDAAVAAAFTACVSAPSRSGIGGYGGHMVIALEGGRKLTAIDFNTAAPEAATPGMFPLDDAGKVKGRVNFHGWLAAGVPGIPAGLALAAKNHGTRPLGELLQPAIKIARDGIVIPAPLGNTLRTAAPQFAKDEGSQKLYFRDGKIIKAGETFRNPELAEMLAALAKANSVDAFYRGDIATRITEAFKANQGLVTTKDLAAYEAKETPASGIEVGKYRIVTAPLTAAGLTVLEALGSASQLESARFSENQKVHARLEALRLAWKDRLDIYGDPEFVSVPVTKLLSKDYWHDGAERVKKAVADKKPIETGLQRHTDDGTNNLCIVDKAGNMVAITLTHGGSFGAQVTVDGLGLTLGHGMSRFDVHPEHPNAPGPGKRPVHNMCPSLVLREGKPALAIGCAGGVRIPNCLYDALTRYVFDGASMANAVAAPRLHCTGTIDVALEPDWPKGSADYLKSIDFKVGRWESSAVLSAASFDPKSHECRGIVRGPAVLDIHEQPFA